MKKIYLIFLLTMISTSLPTCSKKIKKYKADNTSFSFSQEESLLCRIDFQDFFENDTVSFIICDSLIMHKELISSSKTAGFTGVSFSIFKSSGSAVLVKKSKLEYWKLVCPVNLLEKREFDFTIIINDRILEFNRNIGDKNFLGISKLVRVDKERDWDVEIIQSQEKFLYY